MNNMYNNEAIVKNIRVARLYRNYSQDYMAYRLGISQNAYSKVELGVTSISVERILLIADVLDIDVTRLIDVNKVIGPKDMQW